MSNQGGGERTTHSFRKPVLKRALIDFNQLYRKSRLFLEYVLLPGINDSEKDAREAAGFGRGLKTTVNLIAYNPGSRPLDFAAR